MDFFFIVRWTAAHAGQRRQCQLASEQGVRPPCLVGTAAPAALRMVTRKNQHGVTTSLKVCMSQESNWCEGYSPPHNVVQANSVLSCKPICELDPTRRQLGWLFLHILSPPQSVFRDEMVHVCPRKGGAVHD